MEKKYYDISMSENKRDILTNGLFAVKGENILLSEIKDELEDFAGQKFRNRNYSLFEVSEGGVTDKLRVDNITVVGSTSLFPLQSGYIEPKF
jgi:hypothetical protein